MRGKKKKSISNQILMRKGALILAVFFCLNALPAIVRGQTCPSILEQANSVLLQFAVDDVDKIQSSLNALRPQVVKLDDAASPEDGEVSSKQRLDNILEVIDKNLTIDSLSMMYHDFLLALHYEQYPNLLKEFEHSKGRKFLLFTTSVSCPCTMDMCRDQLKTLLRYRNAIGNTIPLLIVDTWRTDELKQKYRVLFVPTVMYFDGNQVPKKTWIRDMRLAYELENLP